MNINKYRLPLLNSIYPKLLQTELGLDLNINEFDSIVNDLENFGDVLKSQPGSVVFLGDRIYNIEMEACRYANEKFIDRVILNSTTELTVDTHDCSPLKKYQLVYDAILDLTESQPNNHWSIITGNTMANFVKAYSVSFLSAGYVDFKSSDGLTRLVGKLKNIPLYVTFDKQLENMFIVGYPDMVSETFVSTLIKVEN